MATAYELGWSVGRMRGGCSELRLKRLAQRKLRQVLELLDAEGSAELGDAFGLVGEAEVAIDLLLQRRECDDE